MKMTAKQCQEKFLEEVDASAKKLLKRLSKIPLNSDRSIDAVEDAAGILSILDGIKIKKELRCMMIVMDERIDDSRDMMEEKDARKNIVI